MEWVIKDEKIVLRLKQGKYVHISSEKMFLSLFYDQEIIFNEKALPSLRKTFPSFNFSNIPLRPAIIIRQLDGREIRASLGGRYGEDHFYFNSKSDQIIVRGKWYPIAVDEIEELQTRLTKLGVALEQALNLGQLIRLRSEAEELNLFELDNLDITSLRTGGSISSIEGLNAELYEYQKVGVSFLQLISEQGLGCILADEMGLGKTLQVIALLQLESIKKRGCSIVVAPASLLENWRRELTHFAPYLQVLIHAGAERPGDFRALLTFDVIIVSYETVVKDEILLSQISWNVVILDEAQNIKNPTAKRTNAIKSLERRVSIAVTGTPLENSVIDLWSIANFVLPSILGSLTDFESKFENEQSDATDLEPLVTPIVIRRRVADVAKDLPRKIETYRPILMTQKLVDSYEKLRLDVLKEYDGAAHMVATTKLRLFCTHPQLVMDWNEDPLFEMTKYQLAISLLERVFQVNEKVIVFTSYQGMIDIFYQDVKARWPNVIVGSIDGRTPVCKRQQLLDEYSSFEGPGVLLLNPKAAGAGLNITAANHVVHYNPEWNPALTAQASARAFRRKQEKPVTIHHLYFANTLEELIMEKAQFKKELSDNAIVGHDGYVEESIFQTALNISPLDLRNEYE